MLLDFQWLFWGLLYINDFHIFQIQFQILIHTLDTLHQSSLKYLFFIQKMENRAVRLSPENPAVWWAVFQDCGIKSEISHVSYSVSKSLI